MNSKTLFTLTTESSSKPKSSHNSKKQKRSYRKTKEQHNNYISNYEDDNDSVSGRWTKEEHQRFLSGLEIYGRNWRKVQSYVSTRSITQVRSHAQKYFANSSPSQRIELNMRDSSSPSITKQKRTKTGKNKAKSKEENKNNTFSPLSEEETNLILIQEHTPEVKSIPDYECFTQSIKHLSSLQYSDDIEFDNCLPEPIKPLELSIDLEGIETNAVEEKEILIDFSNIL